MPTRQRVNADAQSGAVLLLVLWLTAALSFVALALALSVRTELAATSYRLEAEQARLLARGALEQTIYVMKNPGLRDAAQQPIYQPGQTHIDFSYETGAARVAIVSESGKLNVNTASVERLRRLLEAAGAGEQQAGEIAEAIADWRAPARSTVSSRFDQFYASLGEPYRASHLSFERVEELLLVKGVTPELFYGWMARDSDGRLVRRGGLNRFLTCYGTFGLINVNYAPYEVLRAAPGIDDEQARALVAGRGGGPYRSLADLPLGISLEALPQLTIGDGVGAYALLATGRPHGSATRATVKAVLARDPVSGEMKLLVWEEQAVAQEAFEALE